MSIKGLVLGTIIFLCFSVSLPLAWISSSLETTGDLGIQLTNLVCISTVLPDP